MSIDDTLKSIERRTCRIETRLTKHIAATGGDTGGRRPMLSGDEIIAPGYFCTIADLMDVVPSGRGGEQFPVKIDGKVVATLHTKGSVK